MPIYRVELAKSDRSACSQKSKNPNIRKCTEDTKFIPKGDVIHSHYSSIIIHEVYFFSYFYSLILILTTHSGDIIRIGSIIPPQPTLT